MNVFRFLWNLLNTANAGPIAGSANARPVIQPPADAKPAGDDDDDDKDGDEEDDDKAGDDEPADGDKPDGEDDDDDEEDADGDDDKDPDDDLDADDDKDGKDGADDLDEDTASLRDNVEARLEAMTERDPTFDASGIHLDFTKTKMTAEKRSALKKKLLAGIEEPTADEVARAEATIDALEDQSKEAAVELLSQYHNVAMKPVAQATSLAGRERVNAKRLQTLVKTLGPRFTPEVDAALGDLYAGLVKKFGFVRADTVPYERLFRMLPRKLRDASRAAAADGGKPEAESKAERRARREREDALGAAGAPRGAIGRVSPKGGKPDKDTPEKKNQRAVAETIRQGGGKFF